MRFIRCYKLADWCLKVIIENLNLFVYNRTLPQKHIDFLLRVYSEEIFHEYCSLNTISEDYMIWFLNPYSKKITLSLITEKVFDQLQVVGTIRKKIHDSAPPEGKSWLRACMEYIIIIRHEVFKWAAQDDTDAVHQSTISFSPTQLSGADHFTVPCLKDIQTITELSLKLSLASEKILNSIICCVPSLKYLDLSSTSCTDKTLLFLERMCPQLVTLNLKGCEEVTNEGMINLCDGGNLSLQYLDIVDTEVEYDGLRIILTGMPTLNILKFNNLGDAFCYTHEYEFVTDTYRDIKYNLTELRYEGTEMCDNTLTVVSMWTAMCPKVKKVHFLCPVSEEVLRRCTQFQYLEELRIKTSFKQKYMSMIDAITPILPLSNNLKTLILSCVKIPIPTLIENFTNLKCLFLNNVQFTDFKIEDIKTTETKLETLIIKDNNFELSSAASKAIAVLISSSKNVTNLKLNCTSAVPENTFHIILNLMKKLVFVDLSYCNVKMNSVVKFFEVPTMRQIYLDLCNSCFSFDQYCALKNVHNNSSPCTVSWRTMTDNPDDSDSDVLSDG